MDIKKLMKQAEAMQSRLTAELKELRVEGRAGGGVVRVTLDGHKEIQSVHLESEILNPSDRDMVQDLIVAALRDAARQVDEEVRSRMGGLGLPGM